jgi:hypothetical protein
MTDAAPFSGRASTTDCALLSHHMNRLICHLKQSLKRCVGVLQILPAFFLHGMICHRMPSKPPKGVEPSTSRLQIKCRVRNARRKPWFQQRAQRRAQRGARRLTQLYKA